MIPFLIGLAIGGVAGLFAAALCQVSREADERIQRMLDNVERHGARALRLVPDDTPRATIDIAQARYHDRTNWRHARRGPVA